MDILLGIVEGVENHGLDLLVGEAVGRFDLDLGFLAAALLAGGDVQDAVGVDEELDLDARQAGGHGRNAFEVEAGQGAAVLRHLALALHDVDGDVGLAVDAGGEVFGGGGGDGRVALDDLGDDSAEGFDAERKRSHVEEEHILGGRGAAFEDVRLHGCAEGDDLVGIEFGVRLFAALGEMEDLISEAADERNARRAADEDDFIDLLGREAGILQGLRTGADGAVEHRLDDLFELLAGDFAAVGLAVRAMSTSMYAIHQQSTARSWLR